MERGVGKVRKALTLLMGNLDPLFFPLNPSPPGSGSGEGQGKDLTYFAMEVSRARSSWNASEEEASLSSYLAVGLNNPQLSVTRL